MRFAFFIIIFILPLWIIISSNSSYSSENAELSVNFNSTAQDLGHVDASLKEVLKELKTVGKKAGVENITIYQLNYNLDPQEGYPDGPYRISGTVTLDVVSINKVSEFVAMLNKKGYVSHTTQRCGFPTPPMNIISKFPVSPQSGPIDRE